MAKGLALIQALIQKRQIEYSMWPILYIGKRHLNLQNRGEQCKRRVLLLSVDPFLGFRHP